MVKLMVMVVVVVEGVAEDDGEGSEILLDEDRRGCRSLRWIRISLGTANAGSTFRLCTFCVQIDWRHYFSRCSRYTSLTCLSGT